MALDRMPEIGDLVKAEGCIFSVTEVCGKTEVVDSSEFCGCSIRHSTCVEGKHSRIYGTECIAASHFVHPDTVWQWAEDPFDRMVKQVREEAGISADD